MKTTKIEPNTFISAVPYIEIQQYHMLFWNIDQMYIRNLILNRVPDTLDIFTHQFIDRFTYRQSSMRGTDSIWTQKI